MHEQIENEYIIGLLQQRSHTVYNVHSDNKLSEMLTLFEKGLRSVKVSVSFETRCWNYAFRPNLIRPPYRVTLADTHTVTLLT